MFNIVKHYSPRDWREKIEYLINICAFTLSSISVLTFVGFGKEALSFDNITIFTTALLFYPLYCLLRLAVFHFKKPETSFGWVCAVSDLLFVSVLIFQNGFGAAHLGLVYCVIALHSLRFNAAQVLALGALSIFCVLGLGVFGVVPTYPGIKLAALAAFTALFVLFASKSQNILDTYLETEAASETIRKTKDVMALKTKVINEMGSELEAPMNNVLSASNALKKTNLSVEQKQYVSVLEKSSEALLTAIDNIMDFTQMEKGALTSKLENLDLQKTLNAVSKTFGPKARRKNLDFLIDVAPDSQMALTGYEKRLHQIINSLVDNAIKFTSKGHVLIRVSSKPINSKIACLHISVEDSGMGLSETQVKALLENHTASETAKADRGLGLKIVQMLLGVQGESLKILSKPGEGSQFSFELHMPYRSASPTQSSLEGVASELRSLKTLIVNDLLLEAELLQSKLHAKGMASHIVDNAQEACLAINTAHNNETGYNLALIDYDMPEFDGLKLAELIRSRSELNSMGMIIVSSSDIDQIEQAFNELHRTVYLTKPYSQKQLDEALFSLVRSVSVDENIPPKKVA